MNRLIVFLLVCVAACVGAAAAETVNVDELPHKTIILPDKSRAELIRYQDRDWRVMDPAILGGEDDSAGDICFEAKFDSIQGNKLKLLGQAGVVVLDEALKAKRSAQLRLGDNIWVCGSLRRQGRTLVCNAVEVLRQLPDVQRYEIRIASLENSGNFESLILLGHQIEQQRKASRVVDINEFDKFAALRDKAWDKGLSLKEDTIKRDDADELFAIAVQWRELRRNNSRFRQLTERCLQIDPNHQRASAVAEKELGLKKFENRWMQQGEIDRILAQRKLDRERMDELQRQELEAKERARLQAIAERPNILIRHQTAMRTGNPQAREAAITALGDAIAASPDAGFGDDAVEILASLNDAAAVRPALERAAASRFPDVRKDVYEALVWRARDNKAALDILAAALTKENDAESARSGISALVTMGGKPAAATLISALEAEDASVREEVIDGLKMITREQLGTKDAWLQWWGKHKDDPF